MTTIVSLHCSGSSGRQWARLAQAVTPAHPVVAPDLIGYGEDASLPVSAALTLDDEAVRIEAMMDATRGPVCLVGHSYGGAVALRVALHRPDRVAGLVIYEPVLFSLITHGVPMSAEGREILAVGFGVRDDVRAGRFETAAAAFVDYWSGDGTWAATDARRQEATWTKMPKVAREFEALFCDAVPVAAYARLTMPVLWLEGETTRTPTRAIAREMLPVLPNGRCQRIAEAGHMGPITHAAAVNAEIVRFVQTIDRGGRLGLAA